MVRTPVGARCRDCAQLRRLPTFDVAGTTLVRAVAVSLVIGIAGGVGFVLLDALLGLVFPVDALAIVGIGYLVGEGTSASVNRKRGRALQFVGAAGMLVAYLIIVSNRPLFLDLFGLLGLIAAFYLAVSRFRL